MKLFEDETHGILLKFLDNKVRKAEEEIEKKGVLSIVIMLIAFVMPVYLQYLIK